MSHTALGVASLSLEQSQSSYDKFCHDQFYHKGEAIRLVNQRIGSIVNGGVAGDGLIAAVTCLMHFEVCLSLLFWSIIQFISSFCCIKCC